MHVELAAAAMKMPAATVQPSVRAKVFDARQGVHVAQESVVEIRKDAVSSLRKPVPVVESALLLDRVAVLHPGGIVERRNIALERLSHFMLEEIVDDDVREWLRFGERTAQPVPVDIVPNHPSCDCNIRHR